MVPFLVAEIMVTGVVMFAAARTVKAMQIL